MKSKLSRRESEITSLESSIAELETKMADKDFYSNAESMQKALEDHAEQKRRLAREMREWENLSEKLESLNA